MKNRIWGYIGIALTLVVAVPLLIDWLIIGNNIPSNISNSDWVGFLGEYIGTIIGFIVSLIGIIFTIRFTKEQIKTTKDQYEEQKRLNNMPILDCRIIEVTDEMDDDAISLVDTYTLSDESSYFIVTVNFEIYNLGLGPALDIKYGIETDNKIPDGVFWRPENRLIRSDTVIAEKIAIKIPETEVFKPKLVLYYEDILGNSYAKSVELVIHFDEEINNLTFVILAQDKGSLCSSENKEEQYYVIRPLIRKNDKIE